MALLILFGFIAGAATAVSPCVLPVLPIALSAGATGGQRRPLGIVAGLAVSFTFATVALVYVISALGLPDDLLRKLAIAVLLGFGIVLMIPKLAARLEASISMFVSRVGGAPRTGGDGFWSGTTVGLSLGLVYAPCAGPILAGVITVSASQSFSTGRLAVALAYGIGSAVVLYFLMLGGRKVMAPLARRGAGLQIAMGAVMVVIALAMLNNYDIKFQNTIASSLPSFLVNPTKGLEDTASAQSALADIRGASAHGIGARAASAPQPKKSATGSLDLPDLGAAPEFVGNEDWFNTPGDQPLTLKQLRGRVVLVDFWTYSCINCIRTLPYLTAWDKRYRKDGLTIVGVHTPEFPFEREASNVENAIAENGIHYPVVQDNEQATWNAYANQYWPAEYFIDATGQVRYVHFGEGEYGEKEKVIRGLLAEAGRKVGSGDARVKKAVTPSATVTTPETYLGPFRAERFTNPELSPGSHDFDSAALRAPEKVPPNEYAYRGRWKIALESATAKAGAGLDLNFGARRVYLVLGSPAGPRKVRVKLDGKPISAADAGADVHNGAVTVTGQRLYNLVNLPKVEHHLLELEPEAGVMAYAFTFG
ncbi:MAG TPA: cytochrome c biogenesis protein DipZ [Solirubrobacterales bacterium]|nr:cytochrome c biogenesis protein DipZ [Solirubrobacterales bacterium]